MDIGSNHDLVMMAFHLHLKTNVQQKCTQLCFEPDRLTDPKVAEEFKAMIGGKFALLSILENTSTNSDIDDVISTFNTAMLETKNQVLVQDCSKKKPWITTDILDLCDERGKWKKYNKDVEGAEQYRKINSKIKKKIRQTKKTGLRTSARIWMKACTKIKPEENMKQSGN